MSTLLLRLAAPLQSWGAESKFDIRMTKKEPTRSGVIGLLACALGMRREDSLTIFDALKFGVRTDQYGKIGTDYHMVHSQEKSAWITSRYYLYDAIFLAALEGEEALLKKLEEALVHPAFPLYLGRRSCPPSGRLNLGIRQKDLREALIEEPWLASEWYRKQASRRNITYLEIVREVMKGESGYPVRDVPLSFNPERRQYGYREVIREKVALNGICTDGGWRTENNTEHNPFEILEGLDVPVKS